MRLSLRNALLLALLGILLIAAGFAWQIVANGTGDSAPLNPQPVDALRPHTAASMDSPLFRWSPGWTVTRDGATPPEPADPATQPAGSVEFDYTGDALMLALDTGDYWGYLYVTVDGEPANLLPNSRGHDPAPEPLSGYKPLYAPERANSIDFEYLTVHRGGDPNTTHTVRIELWRSWGEVPLRAVLVDFYDSPTLTSQAWPGALLIVVGLWLLAPLCLWLARRLANGLRAAPALANFAALLLSPRVHSAALIAGAICFVLAFAGVWLDAWWLCAPGIALLGIAGVLRPALWYGALFFALPFYFSFALPLLPGRSINLVDVGAWLGLLAAALHALIAISAGSTARAPLRRWSLLLLVAIASWAFVTTFAAPHPDISLREWRTVFLAALAIAAGLTLTLHHTCRLGSDVAWIVGGWLAGATLFAALGLLLYPNPEIIIPAEGVQRLRGFYGSPNNLALYLGRTLAVTLALLLFARLGRLRIAALVAALIQLAAFLLTFSKGGLFLALPAKGIALWIAGFYTLRAQGRSTRILWALAAVALLTLLALLPFLGTERFARIIDLGSGTGFLRVNLWRASLQMALDHLLLGVGPDGFLYAYRSQYIFPQAWMEPNLNHPHNWLLDWWTRLGIPGLLLGLAFWGMLFWSLLQRLRARAASPEWSALYIGLFAATLAALAHGLIDLSYALPDLMAVWALFAVLTSISPHKNTATP